MAELKPFASLSSGLLARKGSAKPAMRPQSFGQMPMGMGLEDLGWNDMGYGQNQADPAHAPEPAEHVPSSITALTPAPRHSSSHGEPAEAFEPEQVEVEEQVPPPPVVEQQRAIEATFARAERPKKQAIERGAAAVVPIQPRERRAPGSKGKAAFTLRLDPDRHLKLRLACAVSHRSAQAIVTEALDRFLESQPEIDAISGTVAKQAGKRN